MNVREQRSKKLSFILTLAKNSKIELKESGGVLERGENIPHYYRERVAKSPPDCFLDSVHPIYYWVKALRLMLGLMGEMHGFYDYEKIKSDYANE